MGGVRDAAVWSHSVRSVVLFLLCALALGMIDWAVGG